MGETAMKKTGVGRRKIPIEKIENKTKRNVTFSKRKDGLFKKASELSTLCGSEIAVLVFSEAGKAFTFGNPSADSVVQRYIHGSTKISTTQSGRISTNPTQFGCGAFGWDNPIDRMGLDQLKQYSNYLQNIRDIVAAKVAKSMDCSSPPPYMSDMGHMATTTTHVSNHGNQNTGSNDVFVQEKSFGSLEMHSKKLEELNGLDVERVMIDSPTSVVGFSWMEAESSEYMLYDGYEQQIADVHISPTTTTSSNDFDVPVDDVQLGDIDFSKYLEELIDFYDFKSPMVDSPTDVNGDTQLSTDCFKWKEANLSDVNGDLDVLPSSSSYVDLDAQWGNSLCDIQWEEDLDLLASFSQN